MPADPTKVRDLAYFERHKHRVASGLNSIGQELWEANGLGRGPFGSRTLRVGTLRVGTLRVETLRQEIRDCHTRDPS